MKMKTSSVIGCLNAFSLRGKRNRVRVRKQLLLVLADRWGCFITKNSMFVFVCPQTRLQSGLVFSYFVCIRDLVWY